MSDEKKQPISDAAEVNSLNGETKNSDNSEIEARRKFIKAGIIGVPVILTLKSRPGWGKASNDNKGSIHASGTPHRSSP